MSILLLVGSCSYGCEAPFSFCVGGGLFSRTLSCRYGVGDVVCCIFAQTVTFYDRGRVGYVSLEVSSSGCRQCKHAKSQTPFQLVGQGCGVVGVSRGARGLVFGCFFILLVLLRFTSVGVSPGRFWGHPTSSLSPGLPPVSFTLLMDHPLGGFRGGCRLLSVGLVWLLLGLT